MPRESVLRVLRLRHHDEMWIPPSAMGVTNVRADAVRGRMALRHLA